MAQKKTVELKAEELPEEFTPEVEEKKPAKKVVRFTNEEIVDILKILTEKVEKERNIRSVKENVLNRQNAYQLDGLIRTLHNAAFAFDLFTRPPKAQ